MIEGILLSGFGSFYTVKTPEGTFEARARGRLKKDGVKLYIGDRVELEDEKGTLAITNVKERKNFVIRPAVANVDQIVVVIANASPDPNFKQIDRLLAFLEYNSLDVVLCINKADLNGEYNLKAIYEKAGYKVIITSANDENYDLSDLKEVLKDKISAFAGCSGVGKSSLINTLESGGICLTGAVGKINRGRHTTTHASLIELTFGGFIADTPGFSVVDLTKLEKEELSRCFIEFSNFSDECRFGGCCHVSEPDCAVRKAVSDGKISKERYESYVSIFDELSDIYPTYKKK